jgi:hypothetical protein
MAQWVDKLRWVTQAGGSPSGEVLVPDNMYTIASVFAGRQKRAEIMSKSGKPRGGMRSSALTARLMFKEYQLNIAIKMQSKYVDDTGIDQADDMRFISPEHADQLSNEMAYQQGKAPDIDPAIYSYASVLGEFQHKGGKAETEVLQEAARISVSMAVRELFTPQERRDRDLTGAAIHLTEHLLETYKQGGISAFNNWTPPIEAIREKYLGDDD